MIIEKNYKNLIEYNPLGYRNCIDNGCDLYGTCRCFSIYEVVIKKIDLTKITESIFSQINDIKSNSYKRYKILTKILYGYKTDEIDLYCINRILTINKLYDTNSWDIRWSKYYYGDEVSTISIKDEIHNKINNEINHIYSLNSIEDKIKYILKLEYGFILSEIDKKKYNISIVNSNDILFDQKNYKDELNRNGYEYYNDNSYKLIRGVCLSDGKKWKIIDGYHRISSTKKTKLKIITII